jgi:hypothetical protein
MQGACPYSIGGSQESKWCRCSYKPYGRGDVVGSLHPMNT